MTPLEHITARQLATDAATSKSVGEACAVAATPCVGAQCPLWSDSEGLCRRTYFRERDAFDDMMGRRPGPLELAVPSPRGFCGALEAKHHGR